MPKLFLGLSDWDWLGIISLAAVAMGTACSLFLRYKKSNISPDENGLIPILIFFEKEKLESKHKRWELFWELLLVAGLIGGIPTTLHSISETARLNNENLVLEAAVQWRTTSPKQEATLIGLIKPLIQNTNFASSIHILIEPTPNDTEALLYCNRLVDLLKKCGLNPQVPIGLEMISDGNGRPAPIVGVIFNISEPTSSRIVLVIDAFKKASIPIDVDVNPKMGGHDLWIIVGHKPEK
jgi:hypothetical protein